MKMKNNTNNNTIEVSIFNQKFYLASSQNDIKHVQEIAKFVDERMKETFKITNLSSALKVAILTALNLADDLIKKSDSSSSTLPETEEKQKEIASTIISISQRLDKLSDSLYDISQESSR